MNKEQDKLVREAVRKLRFKAIQRRKEADSYDNQADLLEGKVDGYSPIEDEE
jgi:hypothetical protein